MVKQAVAGRYGESSPWGPSGAQTALFSVSGRCRRRQLKFTTYNMVNPQVRRAAVRYALLCRRLFALALDAQCGEGIGRMSRQAVIAYSPRGKETIGG
jgi:hypothetical protein